VFALVQFLIDCIAHQLCNKVLGNQWNCTHLDQSTQINVCTVRTLGVCLNVLLCVCAVDLLTRLLYTSLNIHNYHTYHTHQNEEKTHLLNNKNSMLMYLIVREREDCTA